MPTELQWEAEQRRDTVADEVAKVARQLPTGKGVGSSEWNKSQQS
ncbi:hypothetical protein ACERII_07340 [Evansella sp. AB-rgal1]